MSNLIIPRPPRSTSFSEVRGLSAKGLTLGLTSAGVLDGKGQPFDLVANEFLTPYSDAVPTVPTTEGMALEPGTGTTRSGDAYTIDHLGSNWLDGAAEFTLGVIWRYEGTDDTDEDSLIGQWNRVQGADSLDARRALLRYDNDATSSLDLFVTDSASSIVSIQANFDLDDGEFHWLVGRYDGANLQVFVDGQSIGTPTAFTGTVSSAAASFVPEVFGGQLVTSGGGTDSPRGQFKGWFISERAWTDAEIRDWYEPTTRWDWVDTGGPLIMAETAAPPAVVADIKTAVVRYTLPNVTGNFTVSIPSATWTPKAVMAFVSQTGGTIAATSVGLCDGTNQRALHVMAEDAQTITNTSRTASVTDFIKFYNAAGTLLLQIDAVGTGLGPGSGQWVFNVPAEATSLGREAVFVFFGGNDLQAAVESFQPNTTQNATATETVGFDPDLVFFATVGYGVETTPSEEDAPIIIMSLGAAYNNGGTPVQAMATYSNNDNVNPSVVTSSIWNNRAAGQVYNDGIGWTGEITSFPANGFTMTTRDGASGSDWVYYLALDVGGGDVSVNTWTWPDSTEDSVDYSITGVGFEPNLAVLITPLLAESFSFNTAYGKGSVINVSAFDADARAGTVGMASNDNVSPTEESSFESDKPVYTVRADGTAIVTADSFTFNSDGVTFPAADLTSTSSSGTYAWGFFVGDGAAIAGSAPVYLFHNRHHNRSA